MSSLLVYNGNFVETGKPLVGADNRSLRYGDGLFETMKAINGELKLAPLHFDRLFDGLNRLHFQTPGYLTPYYFMDLISKLCIRNGLTEAARIRMNLFRGDGGLYDPESHAPHFIIQAWPLPKETRELPINGLSAGIFPDARKACDALANLKSNNFLPYLMAAWYAMEKKLDDCFLLNTHERIADATIANVFMISESVVYTPPLTEGCVAGVMRRHLIELLEKNAIRIRERPLTAGELMDADEIFLTNAVSGIRWVGRFAGRTYSSAMTRQIHQLLRESSF